VHGLQLEMPGHGNAPDGPVGLFVRPQDLRLVEDGQAGWPARVVSVQRSGPRLRLHVQLADGTPLELELPASTPVPATGAGVVLQPAYFGVFAAT
jgi:sulfate/thiosulfate transport system ATP-binding protein